MTDTTDTLNQLLVARRKKSDSHTCFAQERVLEAAAAAGATQLGEAPGEHWIFNQVQLERFLTLATEPAVPPLPY